MKKVTLMIVLVVSVLLVAIGCSIPGGDSAGGSGSSEGVSIRFDDDVQSTVRGSQMVTSIVYKNEGAYDVPSGQCKIYLHGYDSQNGRPV